MKAFTRLSLSCGETAESIQLRTHSTASHIRSASRMCGGDDIVIRRSFFARLFEWLNGFSEALPDPREL